MPASLLEPVATLLGVITPLIAVPLTIITFYLRSLREHQVSWHAELIRRVEAIEASATDLRKMLCEYERDYTTKEEWLRECMHARRTLDQLTETTVRIETTMRTLLPDGRPTRYADGTPIDMLASQATQDGRACERHKDND